MPISSPAADDGTLYVLTSLVGAAYRAQGGSPTAQPNATFGFSNVALVIDAPIPAADSGNRNNIEEAGLYAKFGYLEGLDGAIRWASNPALDLRYPGLSRIGMSGLDLTRLTSVDQTFEAGSADGLTATVDPRTIAPDPVQAFYGSAQTGDSNGLIGGPYNGIVAGSLSYRRTADHAALDGQASFTGRDSVSGDSVVWEAHFRGRALDGLEYLASNPDLISPLGLNKAAAEQHYVTYGYAESRQDTFDGLSYVASYADLITAFSATRDQGALRDLGSLHYIQHGLAEGRGINGFDGLDYVASYPDLIKALGAEADAGSMHFITFGHAEGRQITFDPIEYVASNADLIRAIGDDTVTAAGHYITYGANEGRATASFDAKRYLANYSDLRAAFGTNLRAAELHYSHNGFSEGRTDHSLVG